MAAVVLVTGGSGLVGQGIRHAVEENNRGAQWVFLRSAEADLRSLEQTRAAFQTHKPTHVIHLAARVGGLFKNMRSKVEMMVENLDINNNVLKCCHEFKVAKCVSMSSTCVFPDAIKQYPLTEEVVHDGPPHPSNEGYAYAKRMIDVLSRYSLGDSAHFARSYNEQYGTNFITVIPTNVFGPHDNYSIEDGHVLPGLMHKLYIAKSKNEDFTIWGTGKPLRQFIFSYDLGRLMVWSLFDYAEKLPLLLVPDAAEETSIGDVAMQLCDVAQFTGQCKFDTTKADGQFKKTASNERLRSFNPSFKFTPLREALQITWDWFTAHYDTCRK